MTDEVEALAKVICAEEKMYGSTVCDQACAVCRLQAHAVLAYQRGKEWPTAKMIAAGLNAEGWSRGEPEIIYRAMTGAALGE